MKIRMTVLAVILGTLVATMIPYVLVRPVGTQPTVTDEWPICSTMGSIEESADWAQLDPGFAAGKKAMAASDWKGAIAVLKSAALRDTHNADIQNYIGYSYRRLREPELAFAHFRQALTLNPRHRAAHQHMGETYLAISNIAAAKEHLAALEGICLIACAEYGDLQKAITKYESFATH
jgi:tetratricopeptide (TPR) repeat protein